MEADGGRPSNVTLYYGTKGRFFSLSDENWWRWRQRWWKNCEPLEADNDSLKYPESGRSLQEICVCSSLWKGVNRFTGWWNWTLSLTVEDQSFYCLLLQPLNIRPACRASWRCAPRLKCSYQVLLSDFHVRPSEFSLLPSDCYRFSRSLIPSIGSLNFDQLVQRWFYTIVTIIMLQCCLLL